MVEIDFGTLLAPVEGRPGIAGYVPAPPALDVRRAYARFRVYAHVLDVYGPTRWRFRVGRADTDAHGRIAVLFDPPYASELPRDLRLEFEVESIGVPLEEAV